jgi:hypothetical protein
MDFFAAPPPFGEASSPADVAPVINAASLDPKDLLAAFGAAPPRAAPAEEDGAAPEGPQTGGDEDEDDDDVAFI